MTANLQTAIAALEIAITQLQALATMSTSAHVVARIAQIEREVRRARELVQVVEEEP